ncbi:hypothetical protein C922_02122 [Plasmodium inui San Antonio 1]|uniref:Uncharacterized protein n=1 Tax=Plasmodium inui San Antonio 1 TaxID=1237626 RepID=W7APS3_9APIC|nr:hypothetical protein C922_02122 [Plasmodium inui San Antonio 1]EUD67416.1 hypothetical protein C922_02122 [Plasmodium inui San Antonio 1]
MFSSVEEDNSEDITKCKLQEQGGSQLSYVASRDIKGVLNDHLSRQKDDSTEKETMMKRQNEHAENTSNEQNERKESVESPMQYTISMVDEFVSKTSEYSKLFLSHFNEEKSEVIEKGNSTILLVNQTGNGKLEGKRSDHSGEKDSHMLQNREKENLMTEFHRTMFLPEYNENDTKNYCYMSSCKEEEIFNESNNVYSCYSSHATDQLDNTTTLKGEKQFGQTSGDDDLSGGRNQNGMLFHGDNNEEAFREEETIKDEETVRDEKTVRDKDTRTDEEDKQERYSTYSTGKSSSYDYIEKYSDQEMSDNQMKRTLSEDAKDEQDEEPRKSERKDGKNQLHMSSTIGKPALSNKSLEELNYSNRKSHSPSLIEKESLLDITSIADEARKRVYAELGYNLSDINNLCVPLKGKNPEKDVEDACCGESDKATMQDESKGDEVFQSSHVGSNDGSDACSESGGSIRNGSTELEKIFTKYQIEVSNVSKYFDFGKNEQKESAQVGEQAVDEVVDEVVDKVREEAEKELQMEQGHGHLQSEDETHPFNVETLKKTSSMNFSFEEESVNLDVYTTNYITEDVLKGVLNIKEERITFDTFKDASSDVNYEISLSNVELLYNAILRHRNGNAKEELVPDCSPNSDEPNLEKNSTNNEKNQEDKYITLADIKSYIIERNEKNSNYFNEIMKMVVHFNNILLLMRSNNDVEVEDKLLFELMSLKFASLFNDILHVQNNFDNLIRHINEIIKLILLEDSKKRSLRDIISCYLTSQKILVHKNEILSQMSATRHTQGGEAEERVCDPSAEKAGEVLGESVSSAVGIDIKGNTSAEGNTSRDHQTKLNSTPATDAGKNALAHTKAGGSDSPMIDEGGDIISGMKFIDAENNTRNLTKDIIMGEIKNTKKEDAGNDGATKPLTPSAKRKSKGFGTPFLKELAPCSGSSRMSGSNMVSGNTGGGNPSVKKSNTNVTQTDPNPTVCKNAKLKDSMVKNIREKQEDTKGIAKSEEENEKSKKMNKTKKTKKTNKGETADERKSSDLTDGKKKNDLAKNFRQKKTATMSKTIEEKTPVDVKKVGTSKRGENSQKAAEEIKGKRKISWTNNFSIKRENVDQGKDNKVDSGATVNFNYPKYNKDDNIQAVKSYMKRYGSTSAASTGGGAVSGVVGTTAAFANAHLVQQSKAAPHIMCPQKEGQPRVPSLSSAHMHSVSVNSALMNSGLVNSVYGRAKVPKGMAPYEVQTKDRASMMNLPNFNDTYKMRMGKSPLGGLHPVRQMKSENYLWREEQGKSSVARKEMTAENHSYDFLYNYSGMLAQVKNRNGNLPTQTGKVAETVAGVRLPQDKTNSANIPVADLTKGSNQLWGHQKTQIGVSKGDTLLEKPKVNLAQADEKHALGVTPTGQMNQLKKESKDSNDGERFDRSENDPLKEKSGNPINVTNPTNHATPAERNPSGLQSKLMESKRNSNMNHFRRQTPFTDKRYSSGYSTGYNRTINPNVYSGFRRNMNSFNDTNNGFLHAQSSTHASRYPSAKSNDNSVHINQGDKKEDNQDVANSNNLESNLKNVTNFKKVANLKILINLGKGFNEKKLSPGDEASAKKGIQTNEKKGVETDDKKEIQTNDKKGIEKNEKKAIETKSAYNRFTEIVTNKIKNFTLLNSKSVRCTTTNESVPFCNATDEGKQDKNGQLKEGGNKAKDSNTKEVHRNTHSYESCFTNANSNYLCDSKKGGNIVSSFMGQLNFFQSKCASGKESANDEEGNQLGEASQTQESVQERVKEADQNRGIAKPNGGSAETEEGEREASATDSTNKPGEHKHTDEDKDGDRNGDKSSDNTIDNVRNYLCKMKAKDGGKKRVNSMYTRKTHVLGAASGGIGRVQGGAPLNNRTSNHAIAHLRNYATAHLNHPSGIPNWKNGTNGGISGTKCYSEISNGEVQTGSNVAFAPNRSVRTVQGSHKTNYNSRGGSATPAYHAARLSYEAFAPNGTLLLMGTKKTNSHFVHHNQPSVESLFPFQKRNSTLHNPMSVSKFQEHQKKVENSVEMEKDFLLNMCDVNAKQHIPLTNDNRCVFRSEQMNQTGYHFRKAGVSNELSKMEQHSNGRRTFINPFVEAEPVLKGMGSIHLSNNTLIGKQNMGHEDNNYHFFKEKLTSLQEKRNRNVPMSTFNLHTSQERLNRNCVLKTASMHENCALKSSSQGWGGNAPQRGVNYMQPGGVNYAPQSGATCMPNNGVHLPPNSSTQYAQHNGSANHSNPANLWNPQSFTKEAVPLHKKDGNVSVMPNFLNAYHKGTPSNDMPTAHPTIDESNLLIEQLMKIPGVQLGKKYIQDIDICSDWLKFNDYDQKVIKESLKNSLENNSYKSFMDSMQFTKGGFPGVKQV